MTPGEWIKYERKKAGITQSELAARIGVTSATITRYEKGQREPRLDQLQKIAEALNVSSISTVGHDERGFFVEDEIEEGYERKIIENMRKLNALGKRMLLGNIYSYLEEPLLLKEQNTPPAQTGGDEEKGR